MTKNAIKQVWLATIKVALVVQVAAIVTLVLYISVN